LAKEEIAQCPADNPALPQIELKVSRSKSKCMWSFFAHQSQVESEGSVSQDGLETYPAQQSVTATVAEFTGPTI